MRLSFFIVVLAIVLVLLPNTLLQAAPFDTGFTEWIQPNSTGFVARAWGDEFFWWMETSNGYRFLLGDSGWYYYATLDANGEFAPTTARVGIDSPPSGSYKLERSAARIAQIEGWIAQANAQIALNAQWFANRQASNPGAPVVLKVGLLFVEFQGFSHYTDTIPPITRPNGYLKADFDSMMFSVNWWNNPSRHPEGDSLYGSMRDYWYQMSRSKFIVQQGPPINPVDANGVPRWILLDHPRSYYMNPPNNMSIYPEAVQKAIDSTWLDTTAYDKYAVIFAGDVPGQVAVLVHGHAVGGKYIQVPERHSVMLNLPGFTAFAHMGTYAHEFGHNIGFHDEYSTRDDGKTDLYNFDLMAWGIYNGPNRKGACPATLSPYYRIKKGWISPIELWFTTTNFEVEYNYNDPNVYKITPADATNGEHYLIETKLRYGFDLYTPTSPDSFIYQPGTLLVWHHNIVGDCGYSDRARLKHADNARAWGSLLTDFFPSNAVSNTQSLNDITLPATTLGSPYLLDESHPECNNERHAHFALTGIHKLSTGNTLIDTIRALQSTVVTLTIPVINAWHMLSVPVTLLNYFKPAVFPNASSDAFAYIPGTGYVAQTTLKNGPGYFIKFDSAGTLTFAGGVREIDTALVGANWNLVGSITDTIDTANVCLYPAGNRVLSPFYKFNSTTGYVPSATINPGLGYWVKVQSAGGIVFRKDASTECGSGLGFATSEFDHFEVTDAQGKTQNVYVANLDRDSSLTRIDLSMPPSFPYAEFDARFEAGEFVRTVSPDSGVVVLVINVETQSYPVTVTWELNPENGIEYSIITEGMGKQSGSRSLTRTGSTTMTGSSGGKFRFSAEVTGRRAKDALPTAFHLAQNYPNPFNPETRIHFELPQESSVRLVVYDLLGREVALIVNEFKKAGRYDVPFNGGGLASGVYFYRLQAGTLSDVKKLLLLR